MPELDAIMPPAGVFAYLSTPTTTTTTLADTWYPMAGAFVNDPMIGFVFDTDHIKYTGTVTRHFEVDGHVVTIGDGNGIIVHFGVFINGVIHAPSVMGTYMKNLSQPYATSGTSVPELSENDEIQLVIMSNSAGAVITIEHLTTTMRPFGR